MTRPIKGLTGIAATGDGTHFGSNDIDKINDLLTGGVQAGDPVTINTNTTFGSGNLRATNPTLTNILSTAMSLRNPTNTFSSTVVNPTVTANSNFQFNIPYDYYIFIDPDDGNKYKARNGRTGAIDYVDSTNADVVINGAINSLSSTSTQGTSGPTLNVWTGGKYGKIFVGPGTFSVANSIVLQSNISLTGCGPHATTFKLQNSHANNANSTVMKSFRYDSKSFEGIGGTSAGQCDIGIQLSHFTIDGNKSNNATLLDANVRTSTVSGGIETAVPSWGFGIALYASDTYLDDIEVFNCRGAGICICGPAGINYSDGNAYTNVGMTRLSNIFAYTNDQQGILNRGGGYFMLNNFVTAHNGEAGYDSEICGGASPFWAATCAFISNGQIFQDGDNHANETKSVFNPNAYEMRICGGHVFMTNCWVEGPDGPGDAIVLGLYGLSNNMPLGNGFQLGTNCSTITMRNVYIDNCHYQGLRGSSSAQRCDIEAYINCEIETGWGTQYGQAGAYWAGSTGNKLDLHIKYLPSPPGDTTIYHPAFTLGNTSGAASDNNNITLHLAAVQYLIRWNASAGNGNIINIIYNLRTDAAAAPLGFFTPDSTSIDYTKNIINVQAADYGLSTVGFMSQNGGTATLTGNAATTVFTVAHGLFAAPKVVETRASNLAAANAPAYYTTADATNITFTFVSAPATGSLTYWWNARVNVQ